MTQIIEIELHYEPPTREQVGDEQEVCAIYSSMYGKAADLETGKYLRKYWAMGTTNLVAWFHLPDNAFERPSKVKETPL